MGLSLSEGPPLPAVRTRPHPLNGRFRSTIPARQKKYFAATKRRLMVRLCGLAEPGGTRALTRLAIRAIPFHPHHWPTPDLSRAHALKPNLSSVPVRLLVGVISSVVISFKIAAPTNRQAIEPAIVAASR
jgi:hypothetical protein